MLLGVPGLTTRRKDALGQRCLPSGRRVCVTLGIIGILLDLFGLPFCFLALCQSRGAQQMQGTAPNKATLHLGSRA